MKLVDCVFCNKSAERGKEHTYPKWLQKKILGNTKTLFSGQHLSPLFLPINNRTMAGESKVFGKICSKCNNGWMSNLENQAISIIDLLLKDHTRIASLDKAQRKVLSTWAFKTGIIKNISENYRHLVPKQHFNHLFLHKTPPCGVKVFLGKINDEQPLKTFQSPVNGLVFTDSIKLRKDLMGKRFFYNEVNPFLRENSYNISMQIKKFAFKICWVKDAPQGKFQLKEHSTGSTYNIFPYKKNKPIKDKGFDSLEDFQQSTYLDFII